MRVFSNHRFRRLSLANALNFIAVFVYVLAAPVFLIGHLKLTPQDFSWMFAPLVGGMMVGSTLSRRLAGRLSPNRTIVWGYVIMSSAAAINLAINLLTPPGFPWSLLPLPLYTCGMALADPSLQLQAIDLFPERRGLASSCLGTIQTTTNALGAAIVVPLLWGAPLHMALGMVVFLALGAIAFRLSLRSSGELS